jgi:hypothetical protein
MAKLVYTPAKGLIEEPGSGLEIKGVPITVNQESVSVGASGTATLSNHGVTLITTTGGGSATGNLTLPDGTAPGEMKLIVLEVDDGNALVSVTSHVTSDPEVFTAADAGDCLVLVWEGTQWNTVQLGGWAV